MPAGIELVDVHKRYRIYRERHRSLKEIAIRRSLGEWEDHWVLRGLSLTVPTGTTLGLIGPNGAGKSTTLKLIGRILEPDRGTIRVRGRLSALIELGAGFQPDYTGRENVYLNASLLGLSRREVDRRFDDIVAFAELEKNIDQPVRTYSSGMYMRLGFAVAIHVDPEIMLVDEILAVGDEAFQRKCFDWLERFQDSGGTIVLISHSLTAVAGLCSQVAWIQDGGLQALGEPQEVIEAYVGNVQERQVLREAETASRPKQVELGVVRILDADGRPVETIDTGDPLVLEIPYTVHEPVEEPVFGIAIHRADGAHLYGTNTELEGIRVALARREGVVHLRFPSMPGLSGGYVVTVGVFDSSKVPTVPLDLHERRYSFRVAPSIGEEGVARIPHQWVFADVDADGGYGRRASGL